MTEMLKIENISKYFIQGDLCVEAVRDFSLELNAGEIISIVGSSGSGKSTILQIAGLLDSKYEGEVYLDNIKTKFLSEEEKRNLRLNKLGFVYQYHHLLPDFSARENIAMPAIIRGESYSSSCRKADEFLKKLSMEKRRFHFPSQLSGGEQQRVAIARALFNNPQIILADEPTGNLDPETANIVFSLFLDLAKNSKTSIIFVTHNMELAAKADRKIQL